jgi:hypothetical protein
MPRIRLTATIAAVLVLTLAAACGGDAGDSSAAGDGATATSTSTPPSASTAVATATIAAPGTPSPTPEPRTDGLNGAPVEVPSASSVEFDEALLNVRAGSFPSLDYPRLATVEEATWLADDALVLGALQNGEARAYPLSMMRYHHVANDELGGEPYLVTF